MYSIGEFSDLTGISKRMLRHYDKINLFKPGEINEENGYRIYFDNQIDTLEKIQLLKSLGFSLTDIKGMLDSQMTLNEFYERLKDQELILTTEEDIIKSSLIKTKRLIMSLENTLPQLTSIHSLLEQERSRVMTLKNEKLELVDLKSFMNRDLFMEKIEEAILLDQGNHYHFITFDIDHFMSVNDHYGYDVGDQVILHVISIIYQQFKNIASKEFYVSRFGGDELALFFKDADQDRIIAAIEEAMEYTRTFDFPSIGCMKQITVSCGASFGKKPYHTAVLRDVSTKALIEAKRKGRDVYLIKAYQK